MGRFNDYSTDLSSKVWGYMHKGYPPSQIDKLLNLQKGLAHDIIVYDWKMGKGASMI